MNFRGEQDRRREKPDDDETPRKDEEVCREGLPWVEDGRRGNPRGNLWSCLAIDERKVLLDVVDSWDEMMEPKGFTMPNPPRTLGFSCPRVELLLPTHMRCQSMADQTPLLAQEKPLLDLTAPHLLRSRHARSLSSLRGFSFGFATPYSYFHLREDRGLLALGPCLPLPFP
jgi:hypothetical protein